MPTVPILHQALHERPQADNYNSDPSEGVVETTKDVHRDYSKADAMWRRQNERQKLESKDTVVGQVGI